MQAALSLGSGLDLPVFSWRTMGQTTLTSTFMDLDFPRRDLDTQSRSIIILEYGIIYSYTLSGSETPTHGKDYIWIQSETSKTEAMDGTRQPPWIQSE